MRILVLVLLLLVTQANALESNGAAFAAAEALLRHIAATYPLVDSQTKVCITVGGQEISSAFKTRLNGTGLQIASCPAKGLETRIPIGDPQLQSDGSYQLSYGYFLDCGEGCVQGKAMFALMRYDSDGWHVSRVQGSVSF